MFDTMNSEKGKNLTVMLVGRKGKKLHLVCKNKERLKDFKDSQKKTLSDHE